MESIQLPRAVSSTIKQGKITVFSCYFGRAAVAATIDNHARCDHLLPDIAGWQSGLITTATGARNFHCADGVEIHFRVARGNATKSFQAGETA
jgi:hypothetical protein